MRQIARSIAFMAVAATFMLVALSGCASPAPPGGEPSIRGVVTNVTPAADGLGIILVEEASPQGLEYDKASLTVTKDTKLLKRVGPDYVALAFSDIAQGILVEVWITGPVAESYPIQAEAETVVKLE